MITFKVYKNKFEIFGIYYVNSKYCHEVHVAIFNVELILNFWK